MRIPAIKASLTLLALTVLGCESSLPPPTADDREVSVARIWNEVLLEGIRNDFARPTVHARNLWHSSILMYDAWAVYTPSADNFFLGDTVGDFYCPFNGITAPANVKAAQEEAMSYAMLCLQKDTPLHRAAAHAADTRARRVIVTDKRQTVGIMTGIDFARAVSG